MKHHKLTTRWDHIDGSDLEKLQLKQLRHFLGHKVLPFSRYYGDLFQRIGATAEDITSLEEWSKIPFTSKEVLLPDEDGTSRAKDFILIPDPEILRKDPSVIARTLLRGRRHVEQALGSEFRPILMTSTTGRSTESVPFLYTKYDIRNLRKTGRRIMQLGGSLPEYRHINMFPYAPHLAFWQAHYSGTGYDTFMVGSGGGKVMGTEGNVNLASRIDPEVLIGMPTFIYHVLQKALEEGRFLSNLKTIVLGGEKVPLGMRRKLRHLAGELGSSPVAVISTYGFTEAKMAFPECVAPEGRELESGFHLFPDLALVEIIDPETGQTLGENEPGEIVFTALDSRGSIVLRYRTGDMIEHGLTTEPCPFCGRRIPRLLGNISRVSDVREMKIDKIKGTLVNFSDLEHILDEFDEIGSWQIELRKRNEDRFDCDELTVHLHCPGSFEESALASKIRRRFVTVSEIQPNRVCFHTAEEMRERHGVGRELKEQRFVDNRNPEPSLTPNH